MGCCDGIRNAGEFRFIPVRRGCACVYVDANVLCVGVEFQTVEEYRVELRS